MKKLISLFLAISCILTLQVSAFAAKNIVGQIVDADGNLAADRYDTIRPGSDYYYIIGKSDDGYNILTKKNTVRFRLKKKTNGKYVSDADLIEKVFNGARYTCIKFSIKDNFTADEYKIEMEAQFRAMQDLVVVNYEAALAGREFPLLQVETSRLSTSSLQNAKAAYEKAVEAEKKARETYNAKKSAYDATSETVKQAQAKYDEAVKKEAEAKKAYDAAKAAHENSQRGRGSLADAEAAYQQAVKEQAAAQAAYNQAVANYNQKAEQVKTLKSAYDAAKAAYDKQYADYLKAASSEDAIQNAKDELVAAQNALSTAQSELTNAQNKLNAANTALKIGTSFDAVFVAANGVQAAAQAVTNSIAPTAVTASLLRMNDEPFDDAPLETDLDNALDEEKQEPSDEPQEPSDELQEPEEQDDPEPPEETEPPKQQEPTPEPPKNTAPTTPAIPTPDPAKVQALKDAIALANTAIQAYNTLIDPNNANPNSHIPLCVTNADNTNNWNSVYTTITTLKATTYAANIADLQANVTAAQANVNTIQTDVTTKQEIVNQKQTVLNQVQANQTRISPPSDEPMKAALASYNAANAELPALETAKNNAQTALNAANQNVADKKQARDQAQADDLEKQMKQAGQTWNNAKATTAQLLKALNDAKSKQDAAKKELDNAEKALNAAVKDTEEKLEFYNANQKAETDVKPNFKSGETMTTYFTFWIQNENIDDDDDATFNAGDKGIVIKPVKNAWNTVTWENNDGAIARVKFLADSDSDFYCPALSTRWNRSYDKYFGSVDLDAFMFDFVGNPKLPATSRATLEIYNPFVDEDGRLTVPLTDLYVYELVDGELVDRSSTFTAGKNEDGDQVISLRTRSLGTYIISEGRANLPKEDPVKPSKPSKPGNTDKPTTPPNFIKVNPSTGAW